LISHPAVVWEKHFLNQYNTYGSPNPEGEKCN
jgi:hypothetical protein